MLHWVTRKKVIDKESLEQTSLNRCLNTFDLTALGVGSTLGLAVYVLVGQVASEKAGPAIILSFLIAAIASVFAGLCYAEFGARIPKAGSAYVYSYVFVGEFMAFIIGWNLILEYVIGTSTVARGYSGYIDSLFDNKIEHFLREHFPMNVPSFSSYPDFLSFIITMVLTVMLSIGVKESSQFTSFFTSLNLTVILYIVITGLFRVDTKNWNLTKADGIPDTAGVGGFFPFGFVGMIKGASTCFFAFVGFDAIATTGEEVRNPRKAIPISICVSLFIVFLAYCSVSAVQTLIWPYYDQNQNAPLPYIFDKLGWRTAKWIISCGALAGLSTSLLGSMLPLPRILYAMASDGLIFRFLSTVHPRFQTPLIATILSGLFSGFMSMIFNVDELANMMSIGTLLAYTLVAISVLKLRYDADKFLPDEEALFSPTPPTGEIEPGSSFKSQSASRKDLEYSNSVLAKNFGKTLEQSSNIINSNDNLNTYDNGGTIEINEVSSQTITQRFFNLNSIEIVDSSTSYLCNVLIAVISVTIVLSQTILVYFLDDILDGNVFIIIIIVILLVVEFIFMYALWKQPCSEVKISFKVPLVPLFPLLSVNINVYLMLNLPYMTWIRFAIWMFVGFLVYFCYGLWNSTGYLSTENKRIFLETREEKKRSRRDQNDNKVIEESEPLI